MEFKKQTNAIYYCDYHLVITTKYRKKVINQGLFEYFKIKLKEIRKYYPYLEIKECNHNQDHIHIRIPEEPEQGTVWKNHRVQQPVLSSDWKNPLINSSSMR